MASGPASRRQPALGFLARLPRGLHQHAGNAEAPDLVVPTFGSAARQAGTPRPAPGRPAAGRTGFQRGGRHAVALPGPPPESNGVAPLRGEESPWGGDLYTDGPVTHPSRGPAAQGGWGVVQLGRGHRESRSTIGALPWPPLQESGAAEISAAAEAIRANIGAIGILTE